MALSNEQIFAHVVGILEREFDVTAAEVTMKTDLEADLDLPLEELVPAVTPDDRRETDPGLAVPVRTEGRAHLRCHGRWSSRTGSAGAAHDDARRGRSPRTPP